MPFSVSESIFNLIHTDVILKVTQNDGAGLLVEDDGFDSEAQIDSRQIEFDGNAEGNTVGNVIDIAP